MSKWTKLFYHYNRATGRLAFKTPGGIETENAAIRYRIELMALDLYAEIRPKVEPYKGILKGIGEHDCNCDLNVTNHYKSRLVPFFKYLATQYEKIRHELPAETNNSKLYV